tara:strand:+ start:1549 stop:1881 length:333 start_codon:yes stop_codon:yes gene_type:complete
MDELVTDIINLNQVRTPLEERIRIYSKFAAQVQRALLGLYYAGMNVPYRLQGSDKQISSFMNALTGEKKYMDSYMKHGLNDQRTLSSRSRLSGAVSRFENETGLVWPFKN